MFFVAALTACGDGGSIAAATAGLITKGDLTVCNFYNDSTPGLSYDPSNDTLYFVDTSSTSVIAIVGISSVGRDGLILNGQCAGATTPAPAPTFSGPSMTSARVIAHAPFYAVERCSAQQRDLAVANADTGLQAS
jgi:hypothetical protein